jgi:hypothetical protein
MEKRHSASIAMNCKFRPTTHYYLYIDFTFFGIICTSTILLVLVWVIVIIHLSIYLHCHSIRQRSTNSSSSYVKFKFEIRENCIKKLQNWNLIFAKLEIHKIREIWSLKFAKNPNSKNIFFFKIMKFKSEIWGV